MITNGLYLVETVMLDGVNSERRGVMVFRDGSMLGGGLNFYTVGSYTCSDGRWKGDITVQEHTPIIGTDPWARKTFTIGFSGTYTRDIAWHHGVALLGKRFTRLDVKFRLLKAVERTYAT
jgi:T3SS negative regulator,GrlR